METNKIRSAWWFTQTLANQLDGLDNHINIYVHLYALKWWIAQSN